MISGCPEDTLNIGKIIGENLNRGDVVALMGELGTGKTCMAQGIAKGLDVSEEYYITSPTFTLINEYPGRIPLYHLDVYRFSGSGELVDIGYEEYFYGDGAVVIEWAEKILDLIPESSLLVYLEYISNKKRKIKFSGNSGKVSIIRDKLNQGGFL